jgi:subtilisin family serine protease
VVAVTASMSMLLAACGSADPGSAETAEDVIAVGALDQGVDPSEFGTAEMSDETVGFDDDHQRFVVLTTGETRTPSPSATSDDAVEVDGVEMAGENTVHSADGSTDVDVAPGALVAVAAETDEERTAVAAHEADGAVLAVLVEDVPGAIGAAGGRYLYTEDGIFPSDDLAGLRAEQPVVDVSAAGDGVEPAADGAEPDLVIGFDGDQEILEAIRALDSTVEVELVGPGVIALTTQGDGSDIGDIEGVESVTEEVLFQLSGDPVQPYQWHIENTGSPAQANGEAGTAGVDVRAELAWSAASGSGIVVAVIDTGVQQSHRDLAGRIATNSDEVCGNGLDDDGNGFVDDCTGWDFGSGDSNSRPDAGPSNAGHGTHVAGIVAAGRNGYGVVGVAPDSQVMDLKVSDAAGRLLLSNVTAAINYAVANGADVINMSLGTGPGQVPRWGIAPLEAAVADAVAAGVVVVAAAGNDNADATNAPAWPASLAEFYPGVISVGASTNTDARAFFSNHGRSVSVWAPGHHILSTGFGAEFEWKSGTSMAAPVIAGAAAVMMSADPSSTPASVRTQMQNTGVAMSAGPRIDLARAVGVDPTTRVSVTYRDANALRSDTSGTVAIDVSAVNAESATQMRLSVATRDGGEVAAVAGLSAGVVAPNGAAVELTTSSDGTFPPVAVGADLVTGVTLASTMALPMGDYAFVTELLTADGAVVGGAQIAYLAVRNEGSEIISTTTVAQNPVTTLPSGGGSAPAPTPVTTTPSGGGGSAPAPTPTPSPVTTLPSGGGSAPAPSPVTTSTVPSGGGSAPAPSPTPVTTTPSGGGGGGGGSTPAPSPVTTLPSGGGGGTAPSPIPVTTVPAGGGGSTPTPTPAPSTTVPSSGGTPPATTTPEPPPDRAGDYSIVSMSPRSGRTIGFENIVIKGAFPTRVPVYVWFGEKGISQAHFNDGETLVVQTPPVSSTGVTDVTVKFTTSQSYELAFQDAFTFYAQSSGGGGGSSPTTTVPSRNGGGGSGGSNPTTTTTLPSAGGGGSSPTTTTTVPSSGGGGGSSPVATTTTTTAPSAGGGPVWPRTRGSLTLNRPAPGTALALIFPGAWPGAGCESSSCAAATL